MCIPCTIYINPKAKRSEAELASTFAVRPLQWVCEIKVKTRGKPIHRAQSTHHARTSHRTRTRSLLTRVVGRTRPDESRDSRERIQNIYRERPDQRQSGEPRAFFKPSSAERTPRPLLCVARRRPTLHASWRQTAGQTVRRRRRPASPFSSPLTLHCTTFNLLGISHAAARSASRPQPKWPAHGRWHTAP